MLVDETYNQRNDSILQPSLNHGPPNQSKNGTQAVYGWRIRCGGNEQTAKDAEIQTKTGTIFESQSQGNAAV